MTRATYNATDNTITEKPDLDPPPDKPIEKNYYGNVIRFHVDLYNWEKVMDAYNANALKITAVCRTIVCSPECRGLWAEGQNLEEGKDYEVRPVCVHTGGFEHADCVHPSCDKCAMTAFPIPVKSEDDLWYEFIDIFPWSQLNEEEKIAMVENLKQKYIITKR